jgi:hypothetical protein
MALITTDGAYHEIWNATISFVSGSNTVLAVAKWDSEGDHDASPLSPATFERYEIAPIEPGGNDLSQSYQGLADLSDFDGSTSA